HGFFRHLPVRHPSARWRRFSTANAGHPAPSGRGRKSLGPSFRWGVEQTARSTRSTRSAQGTTTMKLHPILAALRKHKAGVVLIALQIALTLAIVCNAVFIIGQRIERVNRPTGLDENNLFLVSQQWVGAPSGDDAASVEKLDSLQLTDLAALRALPGVASVAPVNSLPLLNSSWNGAVDLKPGDAGQGSFRGTRT